MVLTLSKENPVILDDEELRHRVDGWPQVMCLPVLLVPHEQAVATVLIVGATRSRDAKHSGAKMRPKPGVSAGQLYSSIRAAS